MAIPRSSSGSVSSVADIQMPVSRTVSAFGRLDILVNNAGSGDADLDARHEHQFDMVIAMDNPSAFFGVHSGGEQDDRQGGGGPSDQHQLN